MFNQQIDSAANSFVQILVDNMWLHVSQASRDITVAESAFVPCGKVSRNRQHDAHSHGQCTSALPF